MDIIKFLSLLGLTFDIVGVFLVFYNGLYPRENYFGEHITKEKFIEYLKKTYGKLDEDDLKNIEKMKWIKRRAYIGLWLIAIGFVLQSFQYLNGLF